MNKRLRNPDIVQTIAKCTTQIFAKLYEYSNSMKEIVKAYGENSNTFNVEGLEETASLVNDFEELYPEFAEDSYNDYLTRMTKLAEEKGLELWIEEFNPKAVYNKSDIVAIKEASDLRKLRMAVLVAVKNLSKLSLSIRNRCNVADAYLKKIEPNGCVKEEVSSEIQFWNGKIFEFLRTMNANIISEIARRNRNSGEWGE